MKTKTWLSLSLGLVLLAFIVTYFLNKRAEEKRLAASPAERGWMLIEDNGCMACHQADNSFRAPVLKGLYGTEVVLQDGTKVIADAAYIREAILDPKARVSAGYQAIMPSYKGILSDQEVDEIIEATKN